MESRLEEVYRGRGLEPTADWAVKVKRILGLCGTDAGSNLDNISGIKRFFLYIKKYV